MISLHAVVLSKGGIHWRILWGSIDRRKDRCDEVYNNILALITSKELEANEVYSGAVKRCADMRT